MNSVGPSRMIQGVVDQRCEARIRLAVGNTNGQRQMIDALIDTGLYRLPNAFPVSNPAARSTGI